MGYFFCLDNPSETSELLEKTFSIDSTVYGFMYSLYGAINIFIPFFVGYNISRIGPAKLLFACTTLVFVG